MQAIFKEGEASIYIHLDIYLIYSNEMSYSFSKGPSSQYINDLYYHYSLYRS